MADKKSILEEALLDINNIQNALNANTKEILRSVAKEEINGVVKESLTNEIYDEEDVDTEIGGDVETLGGDDIDGQDLDGAEMGGDMGDDMSGADGGLEPAGADLGDDMGSDMDDDMGGIGMDDIDASDEIDMVGAPDDEVIAIYKKLSGEDEIEIVGDELHLNITEPGEYVVKLDGQAPSQPEMGDDEELDLEPAEMGGEEEDEEGEGMDYEIELDDEDETGEEEDEETEETEETEEDETGESDEFEAEEESEDELNEVEELDEEDELEENIANVNGRAGHQGQRRSGSSHLGYGKKSVDGEKIDETVNKAKQIVSETAKKYNSLLTEATKLKAENQEFRVALKEFRTKLVETVVFNSNLTYVTRLFMEHSTTKGEKQNIIKRFDEEVTNLKESKRLYKTIANELESRKPISESVENKIIKEATTSTSRQLNESTAYVDPSTKRIMDLIHRVEKR
jgi:hypothetical protein